MIEKLKVEKKVNVPSGIVWDAISGMIHLERWFAVIERCQVEGKGAGATRTLTLLDGSIIEDIIEEINHDKQQLRYRSTKMPFPIKNYVGTVQIMPINDELTDLSWSAEYQVADKDQAQMHDLFLELFTKGLVAIEQDLQK